jgi:hypothetical protein
LNPEIERAFAFDKMVSPHQVPSWFGTPVSVAAMRVLLPGAPPDPAGGGCYVTVRPPPGTPSRIAAAVTKAEGELLRASNVSALKLYMTRCCCSR